MRITVIEENKKNIHLRLPSSLILNSVSAFLLSAKFKDKHLNISGRQLQLLFRAIKAYQAVHPEWKLLEVQSHNGDTVEIVI